VEVKRLRTGDFYVANVDAHDTHIPAPPRYRPSRPSFDVTESNREYPSLSVVCGASVVRVPRPPVRSVVTRHRVRSERASRKTCPGSLIVHGDQSIAGCTEDDEPDGCFGARTTTRG